MNKYVSYIRVSTQKQGESGLGMESQRQIISYFYPVIEKEFEETKSGATIKERPILQQAIKYCLENKCILVCAKVDRLSRDVDDTRAIIKQLKGNIRFCDVPGEGEPDLFTITIMALIAERERLLTRIRTKGALKVKVQRDGPWQLKAGQTTKNGKIQSQAIANGEATKASIESRRKSAQSNPNNIRARSVIKDQLKQGLNPNQIAKHLNENQFTTSTNSKFCYRSVQKLAEIV